MITAVIRTIILYFLIILGIRLMGKRQIGELEPSELVLSLIPVTLAQQKTVDLTRRMNPEKQVSVYDTKFQEKWYEVCDEAERAQIGQACYRAYMVGTKVCIFLWVALLILNFVFDFGLLPIAAVLAVWGAMQTVYALECIRLSKRTGDA